MSLRTFTYSTALVLMAGWLLWVGKPVLVPVIIALISAYILSAAAETMARVPLLRLLPGWARRSLVLLGFVIAVVLFFLLVLNNLSQIAAALPRYEKNLETLSIQAASLLGIENEPTWENVRRATFDWIDFGSFITPALLSLRGIGSTLFLVVLYAAFFMAERGVMAGKVVTAMGNATEGERALSLLRRINERIGGYLAVKTSVNVVLGVLSYVLMLLLGIEFALFWSVLIAFLNYIPYIGSLLGVLFPVLLSLAQFGDLWMSVLVVILLTAAQMFVAAYLEPKMMGHAFNLSPFVVLLALAVWSTLWGIEGAILAVPMTASLVLVLAEIPSTRPIAVLLSGSGKV